MRRQLAKFLAISFLCATLAIFWHAESMDRHMDEMDGMSAPCAVMCLAGDNLAIPAAFADLLPVVFVVALLALIVTFFVAVRQREFVFDFWHKDRHRYLMKTIVMLR